MEEHAETIDVRVLSCRPASSCSFSSSSSSSGTGRVERDWKEPALLLCSPSGAPGSGRRGSGSGRRSAVMTGSGSRFGVLLLVLVLLQTVVVTFTVLRFSAALHAVRNASPDPRTHAPETAEERLDQARALRLCCATRATFV